MMMQTNVIQVLLSNCNDDTDEDPSPPGC